MIPRGYQDEAINAAFSYLNKLIKSFLISMPTGSGKSVVIAFIILRIFGCAPNSRIIVATHSRELIRQNFDKLLKVWPSAPAGIYSAGLGMRVFQRAITFAGIQSVYKKAYLFGKVHLLIVDEAHTIPKSGQGMWLQFIAGLKENNPDLVIIGLSATIFRLDSGLLHEGDGALFTDVAYDIPMSRLINEGYLSPLVSKSSVVQADMSGVKITAGEYNLKQAEEALDKDDLIQDALDEVEDYAWDRKCFLFFCAGIDHAEHVNAALQARGRTSGVVHCNTPEDQRDRLIDDLRNGRIKALCNNAVLTTGTDIPPVDCIVLLRATMSKGLLIQMAGRGMRLHPGKENCLLLDFAHNLETHGPIDAISVTSGKTKGEGGEAPYKICPTCRTPAHAAVRECSCGYQWPEPERTQHDTQASEAAALSSDVVQQPSAPPQWVDVYDVTYKRHAKPGKPPTLWVKYLTEFEEYSEWVCFEHEGFALDKARAWWMQRARMQPMPTTVAEAVGIAHVLPKPSRIKVKQDGKYWRVLDYDFKPAERQPAFIEEERSYAF